METVRGITFDNNLAFRWGVQGDLQATTPRRSSI